MDPYGPSAWPALLRCSKLKCSSSSCNSVSQPKAEANVCGTRRDGTSEQAVNHVTREQLPASVPPRVALRWRLRCCPTRIRRMQAPAPMARLPRQDTQAGHRQATARPGDRYRRAEQSRGERRGHGVGQGRSRATKAAEENHRHCHLTQRPRTAQFNSGTIPCSSRLGPAAPLSSFPSSGPDRVGAHSRTLAIFQQVRTIHNDGPRHDV